VDSTRFLDTIGSDFEWKRNGIQSEPVFAKFINKRYSSSEESFLNQFIVGS